MLIYRQKKRYNKDLILIIVTVQKHWNSFFFFFFSQLISLMKSLHLLVEKHKYQYLILASLILEFI
jgi:hypothetical protein